MDFNGISKYLGNHFIRKRNWIRLILLKVTTLRSQFAPFNLEIDRIQVKSHKTYWPSGTDTYRVCTV